ncbi:MAG TPA: ribulose-phosphate 3-epimerase [Planctomycetes bacterium]|nr:ribulose-phosphate 3-epimerase [Planctomycetota bacterium]
MQANDIVIAPSLLSCDFARIAQEVARVEEAGADWHHVDVMDGHFVPNLTIGPPVVAKIHGAARLPLDVHLMITDPDAFAEPFARAGADTLTFHAEVRRETRAQRETIAAFRSAGVPRVGIAVNPDTEIEAVADVLDEVDMVLVMSVFPGFGGQSFLPHVLDKVRWLRRRGYDGRIEMDGGLNPETLPLCAAAGADTLVAGSAVFGAPDMTQRIREFRAGARAARASS